MKKNVKENWMLRLTMPILLGFFLLYAISITSHATETASQVVKVAYFHMGDYYTQDASGNIISYDTDTLKKISQYTNLEFEYVDCETWAHALNMLERHEVDLVGTAQWNESRDTTYSFCRKSYGYTVGELATLPEVQMVYEDYEAIGNAIIGCTENYVRMAEMDAVFTSHNITPQIRTYTNQEELERALESGEITIIAANSHALHNDWNVVEKFSYSPYYFISYQGNEKLTDQIDHALIQMNLREPNADDILMNQYFPNLLGEPLTKEERELIAEQNVYTVYYSTDIKPLSWYDQETDTMKGALIDACKQITELTGLQIEVRPDWEKNETNTDQSENAEETILKYTTLFSNSTEDITGEAGVTDALIEEPFNLYHKSGNLIDLNSPQYSIAFVGKRNLLEAYIKEKYPKCTTVSCKNPEECLQRLESGEVDFAYLNVHIADNIMTEQSIDDIRELPTEEQINGIGLVFTGKNSELLASIVNKGIQKIDQTEISNSMVQYALSTEAQLTWKSVIQNHTGLFILLIGVTVLILLGIGILITYAHVMRKQMDKVEKADADRSEFFARMSHDMRTPMNGILGMLNLSRQSNDLEEIHDNLEKAETSGEYMLSLINDTLDLQKLESGKMKLQSDIVYTKDYFDGIFAMLRVAAEKKSIDFRVNNINVGMEKYIEIDPIRVKQIFTNLISNAIKFTPEGGTVEVTMECLGSEENVSHRKFQVIDTGVGMSREYLQNGIFKPYVQENNQVTSELTGTGLGLPITKNLIEMMGGRLEVDSELGEGTTFTFYLDFSNVSDEIAAKAEEKRTHSKLQAMAKLEGRKILLCEDHPLNAEIAKKILEKAGCRVTWAEDGEKGLQRFAESENHYFDVILMDIRMPNMDGLAATRAIRALQRPDAGTVPIIAMTANAYDSDKRQAVEAGMNAHLAKPVQPAILYETISSWIN